MTPKDSRCESGCELSKLKQVRSESGRLLAWRCPKCGWLSLSSSALNDGPPPVVYEWVKGRLRKVKGVTR